MSMLQQRLATGAVLAVLLIAAIFYLPGTTMTIVLGVLFAGGAWEWAGFLGLSRGVSRLPMVLIFVLLIGAIEWLRIGGTEMTVLLWLGVAWWLIAGLWITRYPTLMPRAIIVVCGFLSLVPAWYALARMNASPDLGARWLLFAFVLVWAADTGAFFVGRKFGRNKLAPKVSPGKTWEGVGGGGLAALAVSIAAYSVLPGVPRYLPVLAVACVAFSIVGDLTVSMFKRNAGLKDSGVIFPGHGGILDRIDSICGAAPLLALGLAIAGRAL